MYTVTYLDQGSARMTALGRQASVTSIEFLTETYTRKVSDEQRLNAQRERKRRRIEESEREEKDRTRTSPRKKLIDLTQESS